MTIVGSGFTGATAVTFGGAPASSFSVDSDTQISALSPPGSGSVEVAVKVPASNLFVYVGAAQPVVTAVNPSGGSESGGDAVTITGSGFTGATAVSFGQANAPGLTVLSDTLITCVSPAAGGVGTVDVVVVTSQGASPTGPGDEFTYG